MVKKLKSFCNQETADKIAVYTPFLAEKKLLRHKREAFEKRINVLSFISGLTDFVPVGGVIADVIIVIADADHYRTGFGLTEKGFKEMEQIFNHIIFEDRQNIIKIIGIDSFYLNSKNIVITILAGLSFPVGAAITKTVLGLVGASVSW